MLTSLFVILHKCHIVSSTGSEINKTVCCMFLQYKLYSHLNGFTSMKWETTTYCPFMRHRIWMYAVSVWDCLTRHGWWTVVPLCRVHWSWDVLQRPTPLNRHWSEQQCCRWVIFCPGAVCSKRLPCDSHRWLHMKNMRTHRNWNIRPQTRETAS